MIKLPRPAPKASKARTEATPEPAGNLCGVLALFARWRPCCCCGLRILFVNGQATTEGDFLCGRCEKRREAMAAKLRPVQPANLPLDPSLPARVALRLRALFATANDNGVTSW